MVIKERTYPGSQKTSGVGSVELDTDAEACSGSSRGEKEGGGPGTEVPRTTPAVCGKGASGVVAETPSGAANWACEAGEAAQTARLGLRSQDSRADGARRGGGSGNHTDTADLQLLLLLDRQNREIGSVDSVRLMASWVFPWLELSTSGMGASHSAVA